jgi:hypothetical protein
MNDTGGSPRRSYEPLTEPPPRYRRYQGVRLFAIAFVALLLFAVGPADPACLPRPPESDARHRSGLALAPGRGPCRASVDDRLGLAYDRAYRFAVEHADDLGYPWDDRGNLTLVVSAVTPRGHVLAEQWGRLGWDVPVRIRTVARSFGELERIKHDVIDIARLRLPGSEYIRSTWGDGRRNRVIIEVQRLTDEVAAAIVERHGTETVAVLVDRRSGPIGLRD